jgi:hypothetical protein
VNCELTDIGDLHTVGGFLNCVMQLIKSVINIVSVISLLVTSKLTSISDLFIAGDLEMSEL